MQVILGVILHAIGGVSSGSFVVPYNRIKGWSWESYWVLGGFFSWLILPFLGASLTVPGFTEIISAADTKTLLWIYFFGLLWGIGNLTYGLTMRYLGLSLGISIIMSLILVFGSIGPLIWNDLFGSSTNKETFSALLRDRGGLLILLGVVVALFSIGACAKAGLMKEKSVSDEVKKETVKEFSLFKGLATAVTSGILSACFSYGILAGKDLSEAVVAHGANPLFQNNVTFIFIMLGGLTTNATYCFILNIKNKSYTQYLDPKTPLIRNYLLAIFGGTLWYLQFFFYGMGESRLNNDASSWVLHMSTIIFTGNMWGLYFNEWKGTTKATRGILTTGVVTIFISIIIIGFGTYLHKL